MRMAFTFIYCHQLMSKFPQLIKIVRKGQIQKAAQILQEATLNINEIDPKSGNGLLQIAMQNEDIDMFNMLVSYPGINLQLQNKEGQFPLETAIRLNNSVFATKLLQSNINPRKKNAAGETAFSVAIKNQTSQDILKKLVAHKFDVNQKIDEYGNYLNLAIVEGQTENFLFLLNSPEIKFNITDDEDNHCLLLAVKHSNGAAVVAILDKLKQDNSLSAIQKQFFINAQNKEGNTALHQACLRNLQTITEKIQNTGKQFGIDLSLKNKKGLTIDQIKANTEKERILELELNQKRKEEKVIRKKEKDQQKLRIRAQEDRNRKLQAKKRKQEQERLLVESKAKQQINQKKTLWIMGIIFVIVLGMMYVAVTNVIQKQKIRQGSI